MVSATGKDLGSEAMTEGVRIHVTPAYLREQSDPERSQYIFTYRIRITNEGAAAAKLLSRHWIITDADGEVQEVKGEGVVGEQPILAPGRTFEYESFCPLETRWGTMEGTYVMERDDGVVFEARVARFYLAVPQESDA